MNWNTRAAVLACLDSLPVGVDDDLKVQTVVVDNGSVDGPAEALATRPDVHSSRTRRPRLCRCREPGVPGGDRRVRPLAELGRRADPRCAQHANSLPQSSSRGGRSRSLYLNPDGSEQPFHFRFPTFAATLANGSMLVRHIVPGSERRLREYRMADEDFSQARAVPQPSASCLLLRRSLLPPDHVLDEQYPIFGNDVKLARTLAARGLELWVTPEASVIHEAHSSARRLGYGPGRRQYLASTVRLLAETESPLKVWLYRSIVFSQNVALWIAGRPSALGGRDLVRALAGDPGELPSRPRD